MKKVIYSNYDLSDREEDTKQFLMEEYPELCTNEVFNCETKEVQLEPSNDEVWNIIYSSDELYWEETFSALKSFFKNKKVIFFGGLGLWDGRHEAGKIGDFETLFYEAVKDCAFIELTEDKGHLFLKCSHHDGTNNFEIKELTDKGYEYSENWEYGGFSGKYGYSEKELHNRITRCSFLSRLPFFYDRAFA